MLEFLSTVSNQTIILLAENLGWLLVYLIGFGILDFIFDKQFRKELLEAKWDQITPQRWWKLFIEILLLVIATIAFFWVVIAISHYFEIPMDVPLDKLFE